MITLHGFAFSNYYNIVKHALLYKGIAFEEDLQYGDDENFLAISPLGKLPALTTESGGHLSETSVCCDYLEEAYPEAPALYPADPLDRARVRQVMRIAELYLELPCRRLIPFAFTEQDAPEALKQEIRGVVTRGVGALQRLCEFGPYLLGDRLTLADIYLRYVLKVVGLGSAQLDRDIIGEVESLKDWQAMMADSDIARRIDADEKANGPEFFAFLKRRLAA